MNSYAYTYDEQAHGPVLTDLSTFPSLAITGANFGTAGRLMLEGATPLAAARNVVAAIGGIVESNPDGSVVCRRRHPVSIPQYGAATVAHS